MADADEQDLASELMVKFIGEEGVDAACSLQHGEYIILGKLVSLTFIYVHPGLKTLHQTIIKYILNEKTPTTEIPLADVQNATVLRAIDTVRIQGRISSTVINISTETAEEDSIQVTLELVLQAFVGCQGLPKDIPSGLIEFNHNSSALSHVNTCAP
ncbi:hypothetical protein MAR_017863, partial [Mya arenaria]